MDDVVSIVIAILGSGLLNLIVSRFFSLQDKKKTETTGIGRALRLVMKDRLRFLCMHYIKQGWIYEDELDDLISMHACYHNDLNGNGYLNELMERVKHLEIRGVGV